MSDEKRKLLTPEQRKRLERFVVRAVAGLIGVVAMLLIFTPDFGGDKQVQSGFNTTIPDATQGELADDKQDAYQQDKLTKRDAQREQIKSLAVQLVEEDQQRVEVIPPPRSGNSTRPSYHKPKEPKDKIIASTNAYRDMNTTLGGFYAEPKIRVDPEKEAMQRELDGLKEQIALQEQIAPTMGIDEQLALMERSYELAAKYMPSGQGGSTSRPAATVTTPEIEGTKNFVNGKAVVNTIGQVGAVVVSSLSQPISDSEFIADYSKPRNLGFHTAVGREGLRRKNTISACIHNDQTITDGQSVRMRLLEPMTAGDELFPKSAIITGFGKIQGDRLFIKITTLEHQGVITPIELTVADSDGQEGIFIPGSMERSTIKEIAANLGSNLGTTINLNQQSAGDQILTDLGKGAIQGASQYIAQKIRVVKVHLKSGYKLMLYQQKK